MNPYVFSISLTILANVSYHLCQRAISSTVHPLISLAVTYLTALVCTVAVMPFFLTTGAGGDSPLQQVKQVNWASPTLGLAIVALELGFLLAYRAGWNISIAALFSNVTVSLILIPIGLLFLSENLDSSKWAGVALSICGIYLIGKK